MKNNKNESWLWKAIKILFILGLVFFTYIFGYSVGNERGRAETTQVFLQKRVNLYGSYFDQNDNLQLNTFSCTPNDTDGDCSRQIAANYVSISRHWLDYCRRVSNAAFGNAINNAQKLRDSIGSYSPLLLPTAACNDGTFSYSAHNSGTCSGHRGVMYWY